MKLLKTFIAIFVMAVVIAMIYTQNPDYVYCAPLVLPACLQGELCNVDWNLDCDDKPRPGGICRAIYYIPDTGWEFPYANGWSNVENVKAAICDGVLFVTGPLKGSKAKPAANKVKNKSCSPEQTISLTETITFMDYNAEENLKDIEFWNNILTNQRFLQFGYIRGGDFLVMVIENYDTEAGQVVEEDALAGYTYKDFAVIYTRFTNNLEIPVYVEGLLAMLEELEITVECGSEYVC